MNPRSSMIYLHNRTQNNLLHLPLRMEPLTLIINPIHLNTEMEKTTADTNELVDYNEEEDAQLAVAPTQETEDTSAK